MAMIKCPECGHMVSDKAPTCPYCGVEIAGKVTGNAGGSSPKKKNHTPLIAGLVIALIVCAVGFYIYSDAKASKEEAQYELAMKSDDPIVLQNFLDTYKDAPAEHLDSITARLETLKQIDTEWNNVLVSGSKQALLDYLERHPDTGHKIEIDHKIDSMDWAMADNENTLAAMQSYLNAHPNGEHVDEANTALKQIKTKTVQPEEKTMVATVLRHFFQAINSRNEARLESTVAPVMTNFLGKADATKADAVLFMNKIYKEDITNMNWHVVNNMKIDKKEVGDMEYEYTVNFSATLDITRTDPDKEKHANYKIKATINPDEQISAMSMTKILE